MSDDVKTQDPASPESKPEVKPGEKTDPALLLQSLQQERLKVKDLETAKTTLERELEVIRNKPEPSAFSEEGKMLEERIDTLSDQIERLKDQNAVKDLVIEFPALKEKTAEFEEFRKKYPGVDLKDIAELYLTRSGLLSQAKKPKGVEPASGGTHQPPQKRWTPEAVTQLMQTNFREYKRLLQSGAFNE